MKLSFKPKDVIVCSIILFPCLIGDTLGLDCYECNSYLEPECLYLGSNNTFLKTCEENGGKTPFCRKYMVEVIFDKSTRVIRTCGWELNEANKECQKYEDDDHYQLVCQCFTDGCNSAPGLTTQFFTVIMLAISVMTLFICYDT